jgi:hypothetical protein
VTVAFCIFSINTGLAASTVTPGSTAPERVANGAAQGLDVRKGGYHNDRRNEQGLRKLMHHISSTDWLVRVENIRTRREICEARL